MLFVDIDKEKNAHNFEVMLHTRTTQALVV